MADRNLEKTKYFVLAFCGAFVLLSALAVWMGMLLGRGAEASQSLESGPTDDLYTPREQDNLTMVLIGRDTPEAEAIWFFLVRLDVTGGDLPVAVLPARTTLSYEGKQVTLAQLVEIGGAQSVKLGLTSLLGTSVDRYATFTGEGLIQTGNTLGSIGYELPRTLDYEGDGVSIHLAKGRQQVDGQMLYDILRYPGYADEEERSAAIARLLSAYLNARLPVVLEEDIDDRFRTVINLVESDLSFTDYDSRREALRFLAKLSGQHAHSVLVRGVDDGATFTLSDSTIRLLRQIYGSTAPPVAEDASPSMRESQDLTSIPVG